ncbi:hypothetical protein SDC9_131607 [bioreactor metagenome]|uniref:Uncharacterized protein n=1 Tax=bioreactor metagenome TaxID=1076179 RepID=A0A645D5E3_9ZZZZ|nr:hypothetical protein [Oscillospiraceae bacterium]
MNVDTYLYLFKMLLRDISSDRELLKLLGERENSELCLRLNSKNTINSQEMELVRRIFYDKEEVRRRLVKKCRLCDRYAVKLSRAIDAIDDNRYRDFLVLRYMHDYPVEEIAEKKHYAERSLYRIGCAAKAELKKHLITLSPKPRRTGREKSRKYAFSSRRVLISCRAKLNSGKTRRTPFYPQNYIINSQNK